MAWRRLLTQVGRLRLDLLHSSGLGGRPHLALFKFQGGSGSRLMNLQERFQSSYVGSFARRVRDTDGMNDVALLRELHARNDAEGVIELFESRPSLHSNSSALAEYVKALVKVDRLDESSLLKTLQTGVACPDGS